MDNSMLPLGILLLGVAAIAGFMAFRPWPVGDNSNPVKPGSYAVEILQGKAPAASNPPDRQADIAVIEGGLVTLLGVWAASKLAGALSGLGSGGGVVGGAEGEGKSIGSDIEGDIESAVEGAAEAG